MTNKSPRFCECGNRILIVPFQQRKSSRKTRKGVARTFRDHDLCSKCWEQLKAVVTHSVLNEKYQQRRRVS